MLLRNPLCRGMTRKDSENPRYRDRIILTNEVNVEDLEGKEAVNDRELQGMIFDVHHMPDWP